MQRIIGQAVVHHCSILNAWTRAPLVLSTCSAFSARLHKQSSNFNHKHSLKQRPNDPTEYEELFTEKETHSSWRNFSSTPLHQESTKSSVQLNSAMSSRTPEKAAVLNMSSNEKSGQESHPDPDEKRRQGLYDVKIYLEMFFPKFFEPNFLAKHHDIRMYTRDVILQNEARDPPKVTKGLVSLALQLNLYRWYYQYNYKVRRIIIQRIEIDDKLAVIETHFRVRCFSDTANIFPNVASKNYEEELNKILEQNGEWHDYRLIFALSNKGKINKIRLTQLSKREPSKSFVSNSIIDRLKAMSARVRRQLSPIPACSKPQSIHSSKL